MFYIRQGATHKVVIGPVVAVGDGFTPVTTLALNTADEAEAILHDNGTVVDISGYTFAAITTADGYYHLTLQSGISGTVGHLTIVINDDSLCLPVKADFTVLEEAVYDALFADGAAGELAVALSTQGKADVNAEADTALADYDPPTNAEMVARTLAAASYALEATLTAIKGAGWTIETLKAVYDVLVALNNPTAAAIADAVWDETLSGHVAAGSTGEKLDSLPGPSFRH